MVLTQQIILAPATSKVSKDTLVINVLDHGVLGDGTDETTAIQAVLTLGAGKEVFFPGGKTYGFTMIYPPTGTTVYGVRGSTILAPIDNASNQNNRIRLDSVSNVTLRDFTITDHAAARTGAYAPISGDTAQHITISNVEVSGSSSTGLHFINSKNLMISDCYIHGTKADGMHFQRGTSDVTITNCVIEDTGDDSIGFVSHGYTAYGYCKNLTVTNCVLGRTTAGAPGSGIALIGIIGANISNNIITDTALAGIRITAYFNATEGDAVGGKINITGNTVLNSGIYSGATSGVTKDGIAVYNQRNVRISDNLIDQTVTSGISIAQAAINVTVTDNTVTRTGTRAIALAPSEQTGNYLRLWTDPNFSDGTSRTYVNQHNITVAGNKVRVAGTDGIYALGTTARYLDEITVKDNEVLLANSTATASVTGITVTYAEKSTVKNNYVGDAFAGNALTKYQTTLISSTLEGNLPAPAAQRTPVAGKLHSYSGAVPTSGTYELGETVWNQNPQGATAAFWMCKTAGTLGTLNASATTGSITTGTNTLTVNSATGLSTGAYITIAGVTGKKKVTSMAGLVATLDSNADATVTAAAVAYSAAAFSAGPTLT